MFPISDRSIARRGLPFVNLALIAINIVVFLYESSLSEAQLEQFFFTYGVIPNQIMQGQNLFSLLSSMFMHGGWAHIAGNMIFLWVFGDNIEAVLGHIPYLIFYLLGGLAASAAHILFNLGSDIPSLGASGAIAAVLGAYIVMFPRAQIRTLVFLGLFVTITRVTALILLGIWFVMQLFSGLASLGVPTSQTSGIAVWAHIGGFIFGVIVGFLLKGRAAAIDTSPV